MRINKFRKNADFMVFLLVVLYSVSRILNIFYAAMPDWPVSIFFASAFFIAVMSASLVILKNRRGRALPKSIFLLVLLLLSLCFSLVLQHIFLNEINDSLGRSSHQLTRSIIIYGVSWILFGAAVQRVNVSSSLMFSLTITALLSISIFLNLENSLVISYGALSALRSDGLELDHLVVGESAALILMIAFAFSYGWWRILIAVISLLLLFSLGGRTAFFTYGLALILYFMLMVSWRSLLIPVVVSCLVVLIISLGYVEVASNDGAISRMLFLSGLTNDLSTIERNNILEQGLSALFGQVLMGDPTFLVREFGSIGSYIHNILSMWQLFGLIPFVLLCISILVIGKFIIFNRNYFFGPIDSFGIFLFLFGMISVLAGKYIGFTILWFALGFWLPRMTVQIKLNDIQTLNKYFKSKSKMFNGFM